MQGADIPDIEHVIQFGVPKSLSIWIQRAGRAGRSKSMKARATLLFEKSVFQRRRKRGTYKPNQPSNRVTRNADLDIEGTLEDEGEEGDGVGDVDRDDGREWVKTIDDDLRSYIEEKESDCGCYFLDEFFDNPPRLPREYS